MTKPLSLKPLLLTLGDPNGLGPEITVRLFQEGSVSLLDRPLVIIGPAQALDYHRRRLDVPPFWEVLKEFKDFAQLQPKIYLYSPPLTKELNLEPGKALLDGGIAAGASLEAACVLIEQGLAAGLVTCPLNKAKLMEAGHKTPGHTEFLARRFGLESEEVCMHLAGPRLRVSLVTTHPPLKEVPQLLSAKKVAHCLRLTWNLMNLLGLESKPIAVCGLNPHAGEDGKIGEEEERIIKPGMQKALQSGVRAQGPFPADTIFFRALRGEFSSILAMYHDQGLAPLKLLHFHQAVNITLGLPFVRTSVDHGTGYELVNTGQADTTSLEQALHMALCLLE